MRWERTRPGTVLFAALILVNGKIWTGDPLHPEAQAMAIAGDRVAAIGTDAEILKLGDGKLPAYDLLGKRVLPGFNDAHVHFLEGGASLKGPQLRYLKSADELRDTLAEFAHHYPRGHWILNGDWDNNNWSDPALPQHDLIDAATRHWPVFVSRVDGHMSLANLVALEKAGINKKTKDVAGGVIVRDSRGNPTGILKDAAQELVRKVIPAATDEEMRESIRAAQAYANAQGITSVQDMSLTPDLLRTYQTMLKAGDLRVRISGHQPLLEWKRLADEGITADFGNEWLHVGGLKGFADGSVGSG